MNKKRLLSIIILVFVFLSGLIFSIALISKKQSLIIEEIINGQMTQSTIKFMNITIGQLSAINHGNNQVEISFAKEEIYNFVPIIFGVICVLICFLVTIPLKKHLLKKFSKFD